MLSRYNQWEPRVDGTTPLSHAPYVPPRKINGLANFD